MDADVVARELRAGLAETRQYLLAHHEPAEYDRCYRVRVRGREEHLCARCLGVYPGIVVGLLAVHLGWLPDLQLLAVATLPALALGDWALTALGDRDGTNPVRTWTGVALGVGYGTGLGRLLFVGDARVVGIGLGYAVVAGMLLLRSFRSPSDPER
ncbi:DUF2085 domain-containing protein [Haloparvum sp. AD34]